MNQSIKHDGEKPRMDLLPFDALLEVAKVMTFGAKKYGEQSWRAVESYRYEAAMLRHLALKKIGEKIDTESGLSHDAHIACNALFILAIDNKE